MSLEIKVEDHHFMVSDGCEISSRRSNITTVSIGEDKRDNGLKRGTVEIDTIKRTTSRRGATEYLYHANTGIVHVFYKDDIRLSLTCPSCNKTYTLGRAEFQIGEEDYQNATKKP